MTTKFQSIKTITYAWRSFENETYLSTSKDVREPMDVIGENIHSLILNLSPIWTREEYLTWTKHWKLTYDILSRGIIKTKKWRKTSLIRLDSQEVSKARSNEYAKMRLWASSLLSLRKTSKVLAEHTFKTLPNH